MKKTGTILLIITILIFNIVIGANEKDLRIIETTIIMIPTLIYLIILKIKNKDKNIVFKSKIDYFVLAFMVTTTLPIIFRTCASYSDTVEFIMKYFFIYTIYILARNTIKEKKEINIIIITTLICSFIPILLKIFANNWNIFGNLLQNLKLDYVSQGAFTATFGYANALAIYMALCIFLALYRFFNNENKKLKVLDIIYILFALYVIWKAEARVILLLVGLTIFILAIKKYKKQIKENKKKVIIISCVLFASAIVFIIIALNTYKTVTIKDKDVDQTIKYHFKGNEKYTLEFELYAKHIENQNQVFEIQVLEGGKYFYETVIANDYISDKEELYKIEFTPSKDTDFIRLKILNNNGGIIKIGKCYINGKEHILNYKLIPNEVGYMLSGYLLNGKSLRQRAYMYQDSLKIAQESLLLGFGGNAWRVVSNVFECYTITYKECHSYFFELLISYGLVGVLAFLSLIIYFFIKIFKQCRADKEKRGNKLLIALGLFILLGYSITFDFCMSFMLIQILAYIYMAVLLHDEQENTKNVKYTDIVILILLVFISSLYIKADIAYMSSDYSTKHSVASYDKKYYYGKLRDDLMNNTDSKDDTFKELKDFIDREPYSKQIEIYQMYFDEILKNIDELTDEELSNELDYIINIMNTVKNQEPMYIEKIVYRTQIPVVNINRLKSYMEKIKNSENSQNRIQIIEKEIEKLKELTKKDYEENIKNMDDHERNGYSEFSRIQIKDQYQKLINSI